MMMTTATTTTGTIAPNDRTMATSTSQKVVIVNGSAEMLAVLETVLDAGHYDVVFVESSEHAYSQIKRVQPNLVVLYEDSHCLAVVKPAGLLTQAPPGIDSLEARAKDYLRNKYQKQGRIYLGVPHRLDRPVSGVVLFARFRPFAA